MRPDPGLGGITAPLAPMPGGHRNTVRRLHALSRDLPQQPDFRAAGDFATHDSGGDVGLGRMPPDLAAGFLTALSGPSSMISGR